jgi:hypothetical protein
MQLTNESITAMPLPMPMSIGVLMQGKKRSGLVAAITSFGERGALGSPSTEAPSTAARLLFQNLNNNHPAAHCLTAGLMSIKCHNIPLARR